MADAQVWPALRIAPSTAASISASSKTMKGALPQSSKLIRSDLVRALPHQQPANLGRPGEADLSHFRIGTELAADYVAFRRIDQIENAFGKTGGPARANMAGFQGHLLGRLENDGQSDLEKAARTAAATSMAAASNKCVTMLVDEPPRGPQRSFGVTWDGYRRAVHVEPGRVRVQQGYDWTRRIAVMWLEASQLGHESISSTARCPCSCESACRSSNCFSATLLDISGDRLPVLRRRFTLFGFRRAVPRMRGGGGGPPLNMDCGPGRSWPTVIGGCEAGMGDHAGGTSPPRD